MGQGPDYKDTIHLPKTAFSMKANLPTREPQQIAQWQEKQIYEKMTYGNEDSGHFTLPDGPPYANGDIHMGHVLNKVLKDIVIKYKNMCGYKAPFIPVWDTHGLPIEHAVTKKLGSKRKDMGDKEVRDLCRKEALKWVERQEGQFQRLGVMADWKNKNMTMQPSYEAAEIRQLAKALENGVLYKGEKPVYWCWALQTALADAEVEYQEHKSPSIYVKFNVTELPAPLNDLDKAVSFVIWTTTPWTIPANVAISLNAEFEYELFENNGEYLLLAKELKEAVENETGLTLSSTGRTFKGQDLENLEARHPFMDRVSKIILGDHVTLEAGTGCVHTAPAHGQDDFFIGKKYDLPVINYVEANGTFSEELPEFTGQNIFKANPQIIEKLQNSGHLLFTKEITHSYPHCWRSKTPLIFRTTPQWFISMDNKEHNIRQLSVKAMDSIEFFPQWGRQRFNAMVANRPDWCVSRQRFWGVPIPIFYSNATGEEILDVDVMMKVADCMEQNGGLEGYWQASIEEFITPEVIERHQKSSAKPEKFASEGFSRSQDILDVWFDSGVLHSAVKTPNEGDVQFPADVYLEGTDQHRGWFNTSLISALATEGKSPYKALITHGFVVDKDGKKMSKSLGNTVSPQDIINKSGAEILRFWTAYEDYSKDLTWGDEDHKRVMETYRKIRNTMRFLLGNLDDFDFAKDQVPFDQMPALDQWALGRLNLLTEKMTEAYEGYTFYKTYHALNNFFTVDMSSIYLDIIKDRLYTWKKEGLERRAAQTVVHHIVHTVCGLMAPVLSFLAEEVYSHLKNTDKESVFLTAFPKVVDQWNKASVNSDFETILQVRTEVSKVLEPMRADKTIGSSLDAQITVVAPEEIFSVLQRFQDSLNHFFIVSRAQLKQGEKLEIKASPAEGKKCVRCWHIHPETGQNTNFPDVCPKCISALQDG